MVRQLSWKVSPKSLYTAALAGFFLLQPLASQAGIHWFHHGRQLSVPGAALTAKVSRTQKDSAFADDSLISWAPTALLTPTVVGNKQQGIESTLALAVLSEINTFRSGHGLAPLHLDARLNQAAQIHSEDMARQDEITHMGHDGSTPDERISRAGYNWHSMAENVAAGERSVKEVVRDWINSPLHRQNMLEPTVSDMGVGFQQSYWTIDLAG